MTAPPPAPTLTPGRARLRAILGSLAFLLLTFILAALLILGASLMTTRSMVGTVRSLNQADASALTAQSICTLAAALLATWLIGRHGLGLTWSDIRVRGAGDGKRGFGWGLGLGIMTAALALGIAVVSHAAQWAPDAQDRSVAHYVAQVGKTILVLSPAALAEELMFRGVPLVLLAGAFGRWPAIIATSVVFALGHGLNPDVTPLAIVNIAVAGVFLALAFFAPGGLWTAWGAHLGWNATLAALDAPVSGLPFRIPLLDYRAGPPEWLSGGRFGPEGGLAATVALAVGIAIVVRRASATAPGLPAAASSTSTT